MIFLVSRETNIWDIITRVLNKFEDYLLSRAWKQTADASWLCGMMATTLCIHAGVYLCMHAKIGTLSRMRAHACLRTHTHTLTHTYACTHTHMHTRTHTHTRTRTHTYTHTHTPTHPHTHHLMEGCWFVLWTAAVLHHLHAHGELYTCGLRLPTLGPEPPVGLHGSHAHPLWQLLHPRLHQASLQQSKELSVQWDSRVQWCLPQCQWGGYTSQVRVEMNHSSSFWVTVVVVVLQHLAWAFHEKFWYIV